MPKKRFVKNKKKDFGTHRTQEAIADVDLHNVIHSIHIQIRENKKVNRPYDIGVCKQIYVSVPFYQRFNSKNFLFHFFLVIISNWNRLSCLLVSCK